MNRSYVLPFCLGLLLIADRSSAHSKPEATEQEEKAAAESEVKCFFASIERYDDGISDAATVGRAVADSCRQTILDVADVYSQGGSRNLVSMMREKFVEEAPAGAADKVLEVRAYKRNATAHTPQQ